MTTRVLVTNLGPDSVVVRHMRTGAGGVGAPMVEKIAVELPAGSYRELTVMENDKLEVGEVNQVRDYSRLVQVTEEDK